ncbi:glycine zipper 2TM domain-containing protein [Cytophagaceae bacterium SJW1-29]|uniref:Glycine zipper 2TM domain-containing protein n=2 Tax=Salmonirosea aquatica TaxID=2654236 RepID=A0A7C9FZD6_9BACT|nr:glycine zipper 2TM domain-containing protein [Cytophagaceae bacterium SJW1-29]
MELLKAKQEGLTPAQLAALGNSNAYLNGTLPKDARATQQVDNEWTSQAPVTSSDNDAYKPAKTTPTTETVPASEVKKKKGMSTPVKGALIGAGVGAVTGAVVSKNNRVKGAVIGAVAGAGAGAVTGVVIDKRNEKKASTPYYASTGFLN